MKELRLYDVANTAGVATDISHIATLPRVTAHTGAAQLGDALYGADLVIIPAGVPRKPGMTRDDLFNINAGIVRTLAEGVARYCPAAWVAIISNPVNSTVPIAAEVLRRLGAFSPTRLFGVTTLDVVRANAFVGEALGVDPAAVRVPVIGGHAGATILPVLSAAQPRLALSREAAEALTSRIQDAGTEVVKAKVGAGRWVGCWVAEWLAGWRGLLPGRRLSRGSSLAASSAAWRSQAGAGSATLSMAYAAAQFGEACLRALGGEEVVECAYVASSVTDLPFFASPVRLGRAGIVGERAAASSSSSCCSPAQGGGHTKCPGCRPSALPRRIPAAASDERPGAGEVRGDEGGAGGEHRQRRPVCPEPSLKGVAASQSWAAPAPPPP